MENKSVSSICYNNALGTKANTTDVNNALANKMDKSNPVGTGSFSLNRKEGSVVGLKSISMGSNTEATKNMSVATGFETKATANVSNASNYRTTASGAYSHAEGCMSVASNYSAHAEGNETIASGNCSHAQGNGTEAKGDTQSVLGKYNIVDDNNTYAEIVGNGVNNNNRSNARTLDWQGNETLAGDLVYNGNKSLTSEVQRLDDKIDATQTEVNNLVAQAIVDILPTETKSGSVANFETDLVLPYQLAKFGIIATQEAGTPTPSSPKAISGWSQIVATQADSNMSTVEQITIALGDTYYGGYVEVDKDGHRRLVITYSELLDMGALEWRNYASANNIFRANVPNCKEPIDNSDRKNGFMCSIYPASSSVSLNQNMADKSMLRYGGYLVIRDTSFSSYTEIASAVSGQKLIYELATPIIIDIPDGEPITALVGNQNVYCDSGNSEVTYKLSINKALSNLGGGNRSVNLAKSVEAETKIEGE